MKTWSEILSDFSGKKVVVTGGTGLIGRAVCHLLAEAGAEIKIISLDRVQLDFKHELITGDLRNLDFCVETAKGADYAFHLAGVKGSIEVSKTHLASHFVPTLMMNTNMLEAIHTNRIPKAVYTSSIGAYANAEIFVESDYSPASAPMDFAGWAKRVGELQAEAYRTQYKEDSIAIVRPSNVYGPGDNFDPKNAMVVPSLMYRIHNGESPLRVWGDGTAVRDFVYSEDVAEGIIRAAYFGTDSGFVNLGGGGEGVSVSQLVETLAEITSFEYEYDISKPSGAPKKLMDINRAKNLLGYKPKTSLKDGLKETWSWFTENQNEYLKRKNYFSEK